MKPKQLLENGEKCPYCKDMIYAVQTPCGADYSTCPLCAYGCECCLSANESFEYGDTHFCSNCNILFDIGCTHAENGCTSNIFHGMFIFKYKYLGTEYIGMPEFESIEECIEKIPDMEIEWECACFRNKKLDKSCKKACYKRLNYPEFYKNCKNKNDL